jgi:hypothetical protein
MSDEAITLHTVKALSIGGIVAVAVLALVLFLVISSTAGRVIALIVGLGLVIVFWSQVRQVDHHYRACDNVTMSVLGVHYDVKPYCKRS